MVGDPKLRLAHVLSVLAGYVDAAGFLALQGLFTAHVTGNFVTLGASLVLGTSGAVAKLLALPVFCLVVIATRLVSFRLAKRGLPVVRTLLVTMTALLTLGAALAIWLGPFTDGDAWQAVLTGLVVVAAMSIQNAAHRIYLSSTPPTTLMTGTTTQIMIDVADVLRSRSLEQRTAPVAQMTIMLISVAGFAFGCGAAAGLFSLFGSACFVLSPLIALVAVMIAPVDGGRPSSASA